MMRLNGNDLITYSNEYYEINGTKNLLWLSVDEEPDTDVYKNGGYEYRIINVDMIDNVDLDDQEALWNAIEHATVYEDYIECDEDGNAHLSQIENIDVDSLNYLGAYDSSYAMEGVIRAFYIINERNADKTTWITVRVIGSIDTMDCVWQSEKEVNVGDIVEIEPCYEKAKVLNVYEDDYENMEYFKAFPVEKTAA
jgi:hypothetical protein